MILATDLAECLQCPATYALVLRTGRAAVCPDCGEAAYPKHPAPYSVPAPSVHAVAASGDDPPPALPVSPRRPLPAREPVDDTLDVATRLLTELRPAAHGPVSGGAGALSAIPRPTRAVPTGSSGMGSGFPSNLFARLPVSPVVLVTERLRELEEDEDARAAAWHRAHQPKRGQPPATLPVDLRTVATLRWLRTYRVGLTKGLPTLLRALGRWGADVPQRARWKRCKALARHAGQAELGQALLTAAARAWFG